MSARVWHDEVRRLLGTVLALDAEVRAAGGRRGDRAGAWLAQHAADRRGEIARERLADGRGVLDLDPVALLAPDADRWIAESGDRRVVRVGFDAAGTIAVATEAWPGDGPRTVAVGRREEDGTEVVVGLWAGDDHEVSARRTLDGGIVVAVSAEYTDEMPGDGLLQVTVAVATPPEDGLARIRRARLLPSAGPGPGRTRASVVGATDLVVLDEAGTPVERRIDTTTRWDAAGGARDDDAHGLDPHETDPVVLLEAALPVLDAVAGRATPELRWSARIHGRPDGSADDPPAPDDASDERAAVLLRDLLLRVAGTVDLPAPCAVVVEWGGGFGRHPAPMPELVVLDAAFRDAYRRRPGDHRAAVMTHEALEIGEAVRVDLAAIADDATLDTWRRYVPAHHDSSGTTAERRRAVGARLAAVRRRLLVLLADVAWPASWPAPVLPHLWFGPPLDDDGIRGVDPHAELQELWPVSVVAELDDLWPDHDAAPSGGADVPGLEDDGPRPSARDAATSRDDLRRLLTAAGLGEHAAALAAAARWGFALSDAGRDGASPDVAAGHAEAPAAAPPAGLGDAPQVGPGGTPRSCVGGPPLLPPGTPWPATADGEPLTFVAAIDLAEVPPIVERTVLPPDGVLLVYVLVGGVDPGDGMLGFVEHEPEEETATVLHVPAGVEPVAVAEPGAPLLGVGGWREGGPIHRPLTMRPILVPLDDWQAGELVGLHPSERRVYQEHATEVVFAGRGDETLGGWGQDGNGWGTGPDGHAGDEADEEGDDLIHVPDDDGDADDDVVYVLRGYGRSAYAGVASSDGVDPVAEVVAGLDLEGLSYEETDARVAAALRAAGLETEARSVEELRDVAMALDAEQPAERDSENPWSFGVLLGADAGAQGTGTEECELVLLSLDGAADLGLDWGDSGDTRVLIREDDAAAGRWEHAWATGDSC